LSSDWLTPQARRTAFCEGWIAANLGEQPDRYGDAARLDLQACHIW
jgi:hypothetical protein